MASITAEMNINHALEKVNLIPDVIAANVTPLTLLKIEYPKSGKDVALGNTISPSEAAEQPVVSFIPLDTSAYYTLVMTDPDAPSATDRKFGPWRHWVVTNISGANIEADLNAVENQHTPYIGPGPGPETGTHRYTFILYQQKTSKQTFKPMEHEQREHRRRFDIRSFEQENQLELVSVNFFTCPT